MHKIDEILNSNNPKKLRTLFSFSNETPVELIVKKFNIFSRYFFVRYFKYEDAPFHQEMDLFNARIYKGEINSFLNVCFRGASKTTRTKLFIAFCIANDTDHNKRYIKILSKDTKNSTQFVTDIYNLLVSTRIGDLYKEIFKKSLLKREETMSSFTTNTGIKLSAGTVGASQRGNIQDESRPDLILVDDFEDRNTLRSAITTQTIFNNIEEARTGLSKDGSIIYLGNYLSERGNIHKLVEKIENQMIVPIKFEGKPMWDYYSIEEINTIEKDADDFSGEYMCLKPTTLILTKEGWEEISSLKVGDKVITHLNRERKILQVFERNDNELLDITVNGEIVTITKNHPVLTIRENIKDWIPAGELTTDDLIYVIPLGKLIV